MITKTEQRRQFYSDYFNKYVTDKYGLEYLVLGDYIGSNKPIKMMHITCGTKWETTPNRFKDLNKKCPHCYGNLANNYLAKQKFYEYVNTMAKDYVVLSEYTTTMKPIVLKHTTCGTTFSTTPNSFKSHGNRCPHCASNYSKASIKWLNILAEMLSISIQHYENGGEYTIPGTKYRVDGYCKEHNIVFEFHGDLFHGGIAKGELKNNPFTREHGEICFKNTFDRMKYIEDLGFYIFYVFESDWDSGYIGSFFGKHPRANI